MADAGSPLLLVDLPDAAAASRLASAIDAAGEGVAARARTTRSAAADKAGAGAKPDPQAAAKALAEELREAGAEYLLLDRASWERLFPADPALFRAVPTVVLLEASELGQAAALQEAGAFDCLVGGKDLEERAVAYFRSLTALRRRFAGSFAALERRYENLVHALPDIVYELDEDGNFTFVNNSIRLLGYEPADLAGRHFSVLLDAEDAKSVDRKSILELFQGATTGPALAPKLFNERRGFDRRTENLEIRLKRNPRDGKDGELLASVTSYGEVTAAGEYARRGSGEAFVGSVGVIRDITLRRKSEEMLRQLYQAVDQLSAGILVVDRELRVEYVNPAFLRMSRREPPEVIGAELLSFFKIEASRGAELGELLRGGFDFRDELALLVAGGSPAWTAFHLSPVRSPAGDITHAIAVCEDMSQRRAMEDLLRVTKEEAERAGRAKSDFLASMSHELKSPIASVLSAARLIELGDSDPVRRSQSIIGSAQGLMDLLGDILDFVRFETGRATLRRLSFPLGPFVAKTCEPWRQAAVAKGLGFELIAAPDELVQSDPDRLARALSSLLDNAVTFSERGGVRVEASVERRAGNIPHLVIAVSDTGCGIAPADQGRIFEPFVQLASPFAKSGGAGIGLSLARNIVRALGGEIRLESAPERGSTFTILVPAGEPEGREDAETAAAPPDEVCRVLVVDDNEVNLEYMAVLLRKAGQRVNVAPSGATALVALEEREYDFAVLDIQMPGMSGIELGRRIRGYAGDRYDPAMPLLALTAFDAEEVLRSGVDFDGVFAKPVDVAHLVAVGRKAMAQRRGEPAGAFDRRWGTRSATGSLLLSRAEREVPPLMERLTRAMDAGDREAFQAAVSTLSAQLAGLGAERSAAALRRLPLAFGLEDPVVLQSRIRAQRSAWEAFHAEARASLGRGGEPGPIGQA